MNFLGCFFVFQASFDAGLADLSEEQYDVHAVTGLDSSNIFNHRAAFPALCDIYLYVYLCFTRRSQAIPTRAPRTSVDL